MLSHWAKRSQMVDSSPLDVKVDDLQVFTDIQTGCMIVSSAGVFIAERAALYNLYSKWFHPSFKTLASLPLLSY